MTWKTMKQKLCRSMSDCCSRRRVALLCVALLSFGNLGVFASHPKATPTPETKATSPQDPTTAAAAQEAPDAPAITSEQMDSLVAPIALYPDPLLSQILVASTYPLERVQLQQSV